MHSKIFTPYFLSSLSEKCGYLLLESLSHDVYGKRQAGKNELSALCFPPFVTKVKIFAFTLIKIFSYVFTGLIMGKSEQNQS